MRQRTAGGEPSTAEIVHQVLRAAQQPLTFEEICARVTDRRPVTTQSPRAAIRSALSQGPQMVSLGDGRYGYLPHLVEGSLVRVPLAERKPAYHRLIFPDDVRHALFPSCMEIQNRRSERPAVARLPDGQQVELAVEFVGTGAWGYSMPDGLRRYLIERRAAAGDSLVIRVVKGEAGACEAWFEAGRDRDRRAVTQRNRRLADAAYGLLRGSRSADMHIWDLIIALLARGAYHSDMAPDPLEIVLRSDSRFAPAGFDAWMLEEAVTPALRVAIRQRQQDEARLFGPSPGAPSADRRAPLNLSSVRDALFDELNALLASQGDALTPGSSGRAQSAAVPRSAPGRVRMRSRRRDSLLKIYQLKVTLKGIRPPVWRRLLLRADTKLDQLHEVLQRAMGWFDCHLHQFVADGVLYGVPDTEAWVSVQDERMVTLADVAPAAGDRLTYEYDFGDSWEHDLLVEKVLEPEPGARYPVCLKGKRACPPEDVGGVWGYAKLRRILSDPGDPEYEERREWIGREFDSERFDLAEVNAVLAIPAR